jgi:hypothetical protein
MIARYQCHTGRTPIMRRWRPLRASSLKAGPVGTRAGARRHGSASGADRQRAGMFDTPDNTDVPRNCPQRTTLM